ncbi:TPA: hypothetical protein ACGSTA_001181 [Enterobacter cloacae]
MTANNPMTGEQLDELMTVAVNMQRDSEKSGNRPSAMFAYAVQVAVLELRKVRDDAAKMPETSMSITRYWISPNGIACEDESGSFVKYEDYTALEARCAALAAENAGLRAGSGFFMYSEETGFEFHKTKTDAIKSAEDMIGVCREEACSGGWPEDTESICWGVIMQKATEADFEKPSEENGWIGWSEFSLTPSIETPATDAFLAEVRAGAIDTLVGIKTKQLADMHPDTHAFGATAMSIRSQINELQVFAAQLRKGVQS